MFPSSKSILRSSLVLLAAAAWLSPAAAFELKIHESSRLSAKNFEIATNLLKSVREKLPGLMLGHGVIHVEFRDLSVDSQELLSCRQSKPHVVAFVEKVSLSSGSKIVLERSLLNLLLNESTRQQSSCRHQTAEKFVQAMVLHEIAHIFDATVPFSDVESRDRAKCQHSSRATDVEMSLESFDTCHEALNARGRISESRHYRRTLNTKSARENHSLPRTPDTYETTSALEHFAVNFEYFVLDPQFLMRRPYTAAVFSDILKTSLPELGRIPVLDAKTSEVYEIDPARIFAIEYLQAGSGTAIMSRWGHSMFRLVICAPNRKVVNQECRLDLDSHLLVGFGAVSEDGAFGNWKGLSGFYPSQLAVMNFKNELHEYTDQEFRDVTSVPLNLNETEKTLFIANLGQTFWEYRGRYRFLSNNCTTEAFRFLRSVLAKDHSFQTKNFLAPTTPTQLYDLLVTHRLLDHSKTEILESRKNVLSMALAAVTPSPDFEAFIKLSTKDRRQFTLEVTEPRHLAGALLLERWIGKRRQKEFLSKAIGAFPAEMPSPLQSPKISGSYGLPMQHEILKYFRIEALQKERNDFLSKAFEAFAKANPADYFELMSVKDYIEDLEVALRSGSSPERVSPSTHF